jgi:hypothetical protein
MVLSSMETTMTRAFAAQGRSAFDHFSRAAVNICRQLQDLAEIAGAPLP